MTGEVKKTFLEELNSKVSPNAKGLDFKVKETSTEICKKILEEVKVKNLSLSFGNKINYFALEEIIKDLGVKL